MGQGNASARQPGRPGRRAGPGEVVGSCREGWRRVSASVVEHAVWALMGACLPIDDLLCLTHRGWHDPLVCSERCRLGAIYVRPLWEVALRRSDPSSDPAA